MKVTRRTLFAGAGFGVAATTVVRAESLLTLPGDPLTARGLLAAAKWATDEFMEHPAARIAFADGQTTSWMKYDCFSRPTLTDPTQRTYAVAIETCVTNSDGKRFVTSTPVDGLALARAQEAERGRQNVARAAYVLRWEAGEVW